jgi:hypothetical protein
MGCFIECVRPSQLHGIRKEHSEENGPVVSRVRFI